MTASKYQRYGIILAGGSATRLGSLTASTSKHLLPVYDKPMIYYPLATMVELGINRVLIITNPEHVKSYYKLLIDTPESKNSSLDIQFAEQEKPRGISEAFIIAEKFLNGNPSCLILGDNIFYGDEIKTLSEIPRQNYGQAYILGYKVADPRRYGVVEKGEQKSLGLYEVERHIQEKPATPRSNYAVPGLYLLPPDASKRAKQLEPSPRGELEITDLLNTYVPGSLSLLLMSDKSFWFDAGTYDSLLEASEFVAAVQKRRGCQIGNPFTV